jgi:hypothetical protein
LGPEKRPQAQSDFTVSCANIIEAQGDLEGRIQPKTAPQRGDYP